MKKTLKFITSLVCGAILALGNSSCESNSTKNATQNSNSQETTLKNESQSDEDININEIRKQAKNGDAKAQVALGFAYEYGDFGLTQSNKEAKKWYLKSAQQGNDIAQYLLASLYVYEDNWDEAFKWMKKSAELEYHHAQYWLANLYFDGKGCTKDVEKGLYWLEKAAEQGVEEAIEELNDLYEEYNKNK